MRQQFPYLGTGIGLRVCHYHEVLQKRPPIDWFEVISENFIGLSDTAGGRPLEKLLRVRENYPVVLHGVSLSLGSVDPLNRRLLKKLKELADRVQPAWMSDHICWTGVHGQNLHDLLPLPYTEETLRHLVERVQEVQEYLQRPFVLENVSSYLSYDHSEMTEWEFVSEIAKRSGCGLLVDVNNIYVSSFNHGFNPMNYLRGIPVDHVVQIHLAGHSNHGHYLVDTHDHPVPPPVWKLYTQALELFGPVSTLIEWDENIPSLKRLQAEADKARRLQLPHLPTLARKTLHEPLSHPG